MKKLIIATGCFAITCLVLTGKLVAQVGVGTSTPTAGTKLEIVGAGTTSATTALRVRNSSSSTPLLMVRDDGNVGIGTITPSAGLEIVTDGSQLNALRVSSSQTYSSTSIPDVGMSFRYKYNTNGDYALGAIISSIKENTTNGNQSGSLHFWTHDGNSIARKMTITSGGNVGIGTTLPSEKLEVSGNIKASGTITSSDSRLKNVIQSWSNNDQIDFVQYRWKNEADNRDHFGYLAQDVQKVLPDAVYTDNQGIMAVNYDEVHSYKLAMQEKRIKELEQTVEELKKMIKRKRFRRKA